MILLGLQIIQEKLGNDGRIWNNRIFRAGSKQMRVVDRKQRIYLEWPYNLCRRQREDLIEANNALNRYYDVDPSNFFTFSTTDTTRGHQFKI